MSVDWVELARLREFEEFSANVMPESETSLMLQVWSRGFSVGQKVEREHVMSAVLLHVKDRKIVEKIQQHINTPPS